jgi:hypothetical protein
MKVVHTVLPIRTKTNLMPICSILSIPDNETCHLNPAFLLDLSTACKLMVSQWQKVM